MMRDIETFARANFPRWPSPAMNHADYKLLPAWPSVWYEPCGRCGVLVLKEQLATKLHVQHHFLVGDPPK